MNRIRIVIADDHAMVRSGLRALLAAQPDLEVVGEAEDGVTAAERCRQFSPDVVIMDLTMPGRGGSTPPRTFAGSAPPLAWWF